MNKIVLNSFVGVCAFILASGVNAEPTSTPVSIVSIRPYQGPLVTDTTNAYRGAVFIEVDSAPLCDTNTYRIELKYDGSKEIYSAAMAAMMAGKKVKIEIKPRAAGCEWGHEIQSLYIVN